MKRWLVFLGVVAGVAIVAAVTFGALFFTQEDDEAAVSEECEHDMFGHISSLEPGDGGYRMRFDPAWFTSGETANTAAAEDGVVEPGEPVPNDNYRIEEGNRLLLFLVPVDAAVTVLTPEGDPERLGATEISVSELAQLVSGEAPVELTESLETGFWMRYHIDTACSLAQQYLP